jgi:hypothetical protein
VKTEKLLLSPMNVGGVKRDYPKAVDKYVRCCYDLAFPVFLAEFCVDRCYLLSTMLILTAGSALH